MSLQHLDVQVVEQALAWLNQGEEVWLCTVLSTFGSSPRAPGCMMAALSSGRHVGSLSGGCVEEDFLERLANGTLKNSIGILRYGSNGIGGPRVTLPCGGTLEVLVELFPAEPSSQEHMEVLLSSLLGQRSLVRSVDLVSGNRTLEEDQSRGACVVRDPESCIVKVRIGPSARLIIAGVSPVSVICAEFARSLGFEVIVCDPREDAQAKLSGSGVDFRPVLPSLVIGSPGICHSATAVVALTHDPRIDDLAMMEAVRTPAFYIGVMGSKRTSEARAQRLCRSGGLSAMDIGRIYMPVGLALGSKTPAEIALAVMADILRVQRGRARNEL